MAKKSKAKKQLSLKAPLSPEKFIVKCARNLPVDRCILIEDGHLKVAIVIRKERGELFTMGAYLVDTWCRGVYDTFAIAHMTKEEIEEFLNNYGSLTSKDVDYAYVHNLVLGAVEFAEEAGIAPNKGFAISQYVLDEDTDDIPLIDFEYGLDGKHALECSNEKEYNYNLSILERHLAPDQYTLFGYDDEDAIPDDIGHALRKPLMDTSDTQVAKNSPLLQKVIANASMGEDELYELSGEKQFLMMLIIYIFCQGTGLLPHSKESLPDLSEFIDKFGNVHNSLEQDIKPEETPDDILKIYDLMVDAFNGLLYLSDELIEEDEPREDYNDIMILFFEYVAAYTLISEMDDLDDEALASNTTIPGIERLLMDIKEVSDDFGKALSELTNKPTK